MQIVHTGRVLLGPHDHGLEYGPLDSPGQRRTVYVQIRLLVDVSGMCGSAKKKNIMFPISEMTGCHVELNVASFSDCSQLRYTLPNVFRSCHTFENVFKV